MGLDCSHDAFSGAYSAFNRFRQEVAKAMGGSFPPHDDKTKDPERFYWGDGYDRGSHPGLFLFMGHSDCDGEIQPDDCRLLANEMEKLLPALEEAGVGGGHIARDGGFAAVARQFIAGCRAAADAGEPLEFD